MSDQEMYDFSPNQPRPARRANARQQRYHPIANRIDYESRNPFPGTQLPQFKRSVPPAHMTPAQMKAKHGFACSLPQLEQLSQHQREILRAATEQFEAREGWTKEFIESAAKAATFVNMDNASPMAAALFGVYADLSKLSLRLEPALREVGEASNALQQAISADQPQKDAIEACAATLHELIAGMVSDFELCSRAVTGGRVLRE